ncbi:hypothetical protein DID88_007142 [Monilinia fructigena]|uniref:Uncharacterized protein n=1 Tax=Monilinia fructigena TaxID=38457 RepID=A0A395J7U7_9HELO|nr:hypothetical protein DID88_007142 [Monilinia fructigena]
MSSAALYQGVTSIRQHAKDIVALLYPWLQGRGRYLWRDMGAKEVDKTVKEKKPVAALPAPPSPEVPAWKKWGTLAMYAGAAGAVAAGGAAAYFKKDQIQEGWTWWDHILSFVGCLMKGEELKEESSGNGDSAQGTRVGWANLYTRLGKEAVSKADGSLVGDYVLSKETIQGIMLLSEEAKEIDSGVVD